MQITTFRNYLQYEKRFSTHTIQAYVSDVEQFSQYVLGTYEFDSPELILSTHVRSWMVLLMQTGITPRTVNRKLSSLRTYFRFLKRGGEVKNNPFSKVTGPKMGKRLPEVVGEQQMEDLRDAISFPSGFSGTRDKIMIQLLYMAGLRRSELIGLDIGQIDFGRQVLQVEGKGGKDRIVPFSNELDTALKLYLAEREDFMQDKQSGVSSVIVTDKGKRAYPKFVYNKIRGYLGMVTTSDKRGPHVLRHTFATHLAEGGADINAIKELLGHSSLAATQVYTQTSIKRLKEAYDQAHPKA